jgi:hypothetical protein
MMQLKDNLDEYTGYKNSFARNLEFDPTKTEKDMSIFRYTQMYQTLRIPVVLLLLCPPKSPQGCFVGTMVFRWAVSFRYSKRGRVEQLRRS